MKATVSNTYTCISNRLSLTLVQFLSIGVVDFLKPNGHSDFCPKRSLAECGLNVHQEEVCSPALLFTCLPVVPLSSPDEPPGILSHLGNEELNAGSTYKVNCSTSGRPAPLHGEILLLRPDGTPVHVREQRAQDIPQSV